MIRKSTNELSIRPKVSQQIRTVIIAAAIVLLGGVFYFAYSVGVRSGHVQFDQDQLMISQLDKTIANLREELAATEAAKIYAERQQQIQEEAYRQISRAYAGSEQKNRYLGSRLDFYRSIISPEDGQSGPSIQSVDSRLEAGSLNFDITLVQAIKHKHQVQGSLRVELYRGNELLGRWPASSNRSVNYQYFQQISGSIEASEVPGDAKLRVMLNVLGGESIERWFDIDAKV